MESEPQTATLLDAVSRLGPPGTPVTPSEVATAAGCDQSTARSRLEDLAAGGVLSSKPVDDVTVWWRPPPDGPTDRERLNLAIENSPLVLFGLDRDLRYTWVENPHPDFREGDVLGKRDDELLPAAAAEAVVAPKRRALETGRLVREEVTYDLPSGPVTYDLTVEPVRDDGTVVGLTCVSFEVTERKRYERALERQSSELEALHRLVRHDIRNDMAIILGWAELLEAHVDDDGREYLERVLRSGERVVALTRAAADAVEALVGEGTIEVTPAPLAPALTAELDLVREGFPHADIAVDGDLPEVTVQANEMLSSVLKNVLQNAVKHSDCEHPHVEVACSATETHAEIRVADDGPGVPDDRKAAVFGKGEKGPDSDGTGLGLYLVRTLVDQYGGEVTVEDNEPRGAVFVVRLRRAE